MKSLFESDAYNEILHRLESLHKDTESQWGVMTVSQMLCHCQKPILVALGRESLPKSNFLMKLLYKSFKSAMYNDKPWKKNLATPKTYKVEEEKEFEREKEVLIGLIHEFYKEKDRETWDPHPAFGHFTHQQWGMLQYKHLDHHLRQFGV